ncbi:hypothetical protein QUF74_04145 [Candidatus Halobeggiatoa sp. HSG11]|nr:hypothetical protein [Candidatus Halobeggiatoa sp. HSG11]
MITGWVFESGDTFYNDLREGNVERLYSAAESIISQEYSDQIVIIPIKDTSAVLILFPEPKLMPNCFFAMVIKNDNGYRYITYERTMDTTDSGFVGVVGEWNAKKNHINHGSRTYKKSSEFVAEVLDNKL